MGIKIESDKIMLKFTAGEAITKGQVVYVSGDNEVSPATYAEAAKCVGVADNDASAGEDVFVIVFGKATVIADEPINPGDRVSAASVHAGRVIRTNSEIYETGGHSHTALETDGADATPGAHQTLRTYPGSSSNSSLLIGVASSGQGATSVSTNTVSDSVEIPFGVCIGIALSSASAAGDPITILVTKL